MNYLVGLDLGQAADFTAIAVVERRAGPPDAQGRLLRQYDVRLLERPPLGTPYPSIVEQVKALCARPPLRGAVELVVQEFVNFKVKVTAAAHEVFGAWREGQHDDFVLAVALACWRGEQTPLVMGLPIGVPQASYWGRV